MTRDEIMNAAKRANEQHATRIAALADHRMELAVAEWRNRFNDKRLFVNFGNGTFAAWYENEVTGKLREIGISFGTLRYNSETHDHERVSTCEIGERHAECITFLFDAISDAHDITGGWSIAEPSDVDSRTMEL
jgi:hypothetical protein